MSKAELPGMTGKGIEALEIPEIAEAARKYEDAKNARCQVSPAEVASKRELQAALHKHRAELPKNADGNPFYRHDDVDYILEEKVKRRAAEDADPDPASGEDVDV